MYVLSNLDKEEQYILLQHITEGGRGKCAKKKLWSFQIKKNKTNYRS